MRKPSRSQRARTEHRVKKAMAMGRKVLPADIQRARNAFPLDSKQIREMRARDKNLKLDRFSSVGGYPILYLTKRDGVACADCANDASSWQVREDGGIKAADVNYEDPSLYCDFCYKRIESAYAEDDVNE